jgi:hypothetical protein
MLLDPIPALSCWRGRFLQQAKSGRGPCRIPQGVDAVEQDPGLVGGARTAFSGLAPPLSRWLKGFSEAHALAIFATYKTAALTPRFLPAR